MECSEILLRGVMSPKDLEPDGPGHAPIVRHTAFLLRRSEDELSVDRLGRNPGQSPQASFDRWDRQFRDGALAAVTLHTGRVRGLGLEVVPSPGPENPAHAGIRGVPHQEDDYRRAMYLASELQEMARFVRFRDESVERELRGRWERLRAKESHTG